MMVKIVNKTWHKQYKVRDLWTIHISILGFSGGSDSKESACSAGALVRSLGREDPLEKRMATQSSILAWRIPWTERSLSGYSPWGRKESDVSEQITRSYFNSRRKVLFLPFYECGTEAQRGEVIFPEPHSSASVLW